MISEKNSSTFKYISDLFKYCTGKEQKFQIFQYNQVHIFFSSTFQYIPVFPVRVATMLRSSLKHLSELIGN